MRSSLKKGVVLVLVLVLAHSVWAASNWAQTSVGTCAQAGQCLVSNAFDPVNDNQDSAYWDGLIDPSKGPKCIASGQYLLDHYCDNGVWSSRTKLVASRLLTLAVQSGAQAYSVSCGSPASVLPRDELTSDGSAFALLGKSCSFSSFNGVQFAENCANNVCVLRYGSSVAFGMSVNVPINGQDSALRAFSKPITLCTNGFDTDAEYSSCGSDLWYDHKTQSLIYAPGVFRLPSTGEVQSGVLDGAYSALSGYVSSRVNNPSIQQKNYSSFSSDFSEVYFAKNGQKSVFAFREKNLTLLQTGYFGMYFSGIQLPSDLCARVFKRFDDRSQCEVQPNAGEFFVVAKRSIGSSSGIVDAYPVNSLRVFQ